MDILATISNVFKYLLPIVGVAVLVALLILLVKVLSILKKVTNIVESLNSTMNKVDGYVGDFNVTVKTINNISMSIEAVRVTLEHLVKKAFEAWQKEFDTVKSMVTTLLEKLDKKKENVEVVQSEPVETVSDGKETE